VSRLDLLGSHLKLLFVIYLI